MKTILETEGTAIELNIKKTMLFKVKLLSRKICSYG